MFDYDCADHQQLSAVISSYQQSSAVISSHQQSPAVISSYQQSSAVISSHQHSSTVISSHQQSSAVTSSHQQSSADIMFNLLHRACFGRLAALTSLSCACYYLCVNSVFELASVGSLRSPPSAALLYTLYSLGIHSLSHPSVGVLISYLKIKRAEYSSVFIQYSL